MSTIFVQIASYRDPELPATLRDCLANAARPEHLRFGICWQRDETESIHEFLNDSRFRVIAIHYRDSKGVCWARNAIQSLYGGETYTLQLDSHHRFTPGWDTALIDMLRRLDSDKPLITTYVPAYDPAADRKLDHRPWKIGFERFLPDGRISTRARFIQDHGRCEVPIRARFYSAHFTFTWGSFCQEVRYDPHLYFEGEEITMAVRAFTHGYDLYHPHRVMIWHEYTRSQHRKHWEDHSTGAVERSWYERDAVAQERIEALLGQGSGSIEVRADKRFSHGFQVLGSYAYSRNTGTSNDNGFNLYNWLQNTGPLQNDLTQILNIAATTKLPRQFELGINFSFSSALPFSAYIGSIDLNGDGTQGDLLPGTAVGAFNRGMGRSDLERLVSAFNAAYAGTQDAAGRLIAPLLLPAHYSFGDNFHSLDLRLTRTFVFQDRWRLLLIGEVFNLYNNANLLGYGGDLTTAGFGQPTSRATQVFGSGGPRAFQLAMRIGF